MIQKMLIALGLALLAAGLAWPWLKDIPLGRLPGDIIIQREGFTIYIPVTTAVIVSVLLSLVMWWFRR
jgi:hypothetical protein